MVSDTSRNGGDNMIGLRRRTMGNKSSRLPAGYTEVEYIRLYGFVYIELPFSGNLDVELDCILRGDRFRFAITQLFNNTGGQGARWFGISGSRYTVGANFAFSIQSGTRVKADIMFRTISNNNRSITCTIGNETKTRSNTNSGTDGNLILGIETNSYPCDNDYYSVLIRDTSSRLLSELVPSIDSNENYGLYDILNQRFYGKSGGDNTISGGNPV